MSLHHLKKRLPAQCWDDEIPMDFSTPTATPPSSNCDPEEVIINSDLDIADLAKYHNKVCYSFNYYVYIVLYCVSCLRLPGMLYILFQQFL